MVVIGLVVLIVSFIVLRAYRRMIGRDRMRGRMQHYKDVYGRPDLPASSPPTPTAPSRPGSSSARR